MLLSPCLPFFSRTSPVPRLRLPQGWGGGALGCGCNRWVSASRARDRNPCYSASFVDGQVLGEMGGSGHWGEVVSDGERSWRGEAGTFLRTKAGRACELCRGGSRPHKAQCREACPTSLAVTGNNTDLAIKAIPNLLVINHPPDSCEWKWKNLIPLYPSLPPLAQFWGFKLPLGIYGVRCWGLVSSPLAFQGDSFRVERPQVGQSLAHHGSTQRQRSQGETGGGFRGQPCAMTSLGSRAGPWQACRVGEACRQRWASSFHTLSLLPCCLAFPSLPPSATKCQRISLLVPFPSPSSPPLSILT